MNGNAARRLRALEFFAPSEGAPLGLAALGVLLLWFSFYTLRTLHLVWIENVDYSHGYLALALTAWLLVLEIRRAPLAPLVPSWTGLACLLAVVLATIVGFASTTQLVAQASLPALWIAAIWAAAGPRNARRFAPPLVYLYVAIPLWSFLMEPLRRLTVHVVTGWIRAANLPAYIEGNLIHVPSGTFEVQGGCSGLRYAIVAVAIAALCTLLNRRRLGPSMLLIALALLLVLVGNWIRVFTTVAVGQSEAQNLFTVLVRDHHTFFGWLLFALFMIPLFYVDRVLPSPGAATITATTGDEGSVRAWRLAGTYAACALLAFGILLVHRVDQGGEPPAGSVALAPADIPGWQRVERWEDARLPQYVGAAAQTASWYADGAARVGAYVAHYPEQRQEHEVVFLANRPAGLSGAIVARRSASLTAASGAAVPFEELEVTDSAAERRLVWVGLRVAGEPAGSVLAAKTLQVAGAIRGRRDAQALVLTAACGDDCGNARAVLSRYAAAAAEPLYELAENHPSARLVRADAKDGAQ